MQLPNPLASRWGRLMAFFFLYVTEGIPLGFTATTMAVQMKRAGVGEKEIGIFVGSLYLPWAWKWAIGPFVDLLYSNRLGARRGWILSTQIMMVLTLLVCMPIELSAENLSLITLVIMVHNMFCATQDVAIDALACNVLHEDERGLANGLMFAGQTLGIPLGGACVLYLIEGVDISWLPALRDGIPVQTAYWFVIGCILLVTTFVALPMREEAKVRAPLDQNRVDRLREQVSVFRPTIPTFFRAFFPVITRTIGFASSIVLFLTPRKADSRSSALRIELIEYVFTALRSFFGSRIAFYGLLFSLLPAGAVGLNLALQKTVAVEVGFTDGDVADLEVASSILWAIMCVLGGVISDRLGHLKCLAVFLALISIPTFWCAYRMNQEGMVLPKSIMAERAAEAARDEAAAVDPAPKTEGDDESVGIDNDGELKKKEKTPSIFEGDQVPPMANSFWWAVMIYMAFQGLMYGTRTAVFMRIANPDVAATQFTAYMAMMNLVTAYTAWWQGYTIETYGYPITLYIDGTFGLVCLAVLPMLRDRRRADTPAADLAVYS